MPSNWPLASLLTLFVRLALVTAEGARPTVTSLTASCWNSSIYFAAVCFAFTSVLLPRPSPGWGDELRKSGASSISMMPVAGRAQTALSFRRLSVSIEAQASNAKYCTKNLLIHMVIKSYI